MIKAADRTEKVIAMETEIDGNDDLVVEDLETQGDLADLADQEDPEDQGDRGDLIAPMARKGAVEMTG